MKRSLPLSLCKALVAACAAFSIALVLAMGLFAATPHTARAADGEVVRGTATADIAVYAQPDLASEPISFLAAGTTLQALDVGDGWYAARFDGEVRYFLLDFFVRYTATDSTVLKGAVIGGTLDVRLTPVFDGAACGSFAPGATIQFCVFNDQFYMARLADGTVCYIDAGQVRLFNPTETGTLVRWAGDAGARVFEAPDIESALLATFEPGRKLWFADFDAEWLMASMSVDGSLRTVFVPKTDTVSYVPDPEPTDPEPTDPEPIDPEPLDTEWVITAVVASGMSEPSWEADEMVTFRKGAVLNGAPQENGWFLVKYNGQTMYLSPEEVKVIPESNYTIVERSYNVSLNEAVAIQNIGTWIVGNNASNKATAEDLSTYMDPANFPEGTSGFFQFLLLTEPMGVSVDVLNAQLTGKGVLDGQGQAFHDAAYEYGINEAYLISHALHETGNGWSTLAMGVYWDPEYDNGKDENGESLPKGKAFKRDAEEIPETAKLVYNVFGIGAVDSDPLNGGARKAYESGWFTPYLAVYGGAQFIGKTYLRPDSETGFSYPSTLSGQNTLYKMLYHPEWVEQFGEKPWHEYATDVAWANAQTYYLTQLLADYDNYSLLFEVPVYAED